MLTVRTGRESVGVARPMVTERGQYGGEVEGWDEARSGARNKVYS